MADYTPIVLFVCEHGSAKSVVAAALFNRLAAARQLAAHAVARGTLPDMAIAPAAREGLRRDGLPSVESKPEKLSSDEVAQALRVIAFCPLPADCYPTMSVEDWSDIPPVSTSYEQSRDAMMERIDHLIEELSPHKGQLQEQAK